MNQQPKTKILFLSWSGSLGGAEVSLRTVIQHLDSGLYEPHLWVMQRGNFSEYACGLGIPLRRYAFKRFISAVLQMKVFFDLYHYLRKHQIKIVHASGTLSFLLAYLPAKLSKCKVIWWCMDIVEGEDRAEKIAGRLPADLILGASKATEESVRKVFPSNQSRIQLIPHPIETREKEVRQSASVRAELHISEDTLIAVCVGRLQRWKGQDVFLRAVPNVLKAHPQARFLIVGDVLQGMDDGFLEELKSIVSRLKIEGHVHFLGYRENVVSIIRECDLLVHTSTNPEPFGIVIGEGMLAGKPVIATDFGGPREIINHGINGWLVKARDADLLAQSINRYFDSPDLRGKVGSAARDKIQKFFAADVVVKQFERMYLNLLEGQND